MSKDDDEHEVMVRVEVANAYGLKDDKEEVDEDEYEVRDLWKSLPPYLTFRLNMI